MTWNERGMAYLKDSDRRPRTGPNRRSVYLTAKSHFDLSSDSCNNPNLRQYRVGLALGKRRLIQSADLVIRRSSNASCAEGRRTLPLRGPRTNARRIKVKMITCETNFQNEQEPTNGWEGTGV